MKSKSTYADDKEFFNSKLDLYAKDQRMNFDIFSDFMKKINEYHMETLRTYSKLFFNIVKNN